MKRLSTITWPKCDKISSGSTSRASSRSVSRWGSAGGRRTRMSSGSPTPGSSCARSIATGAWSRSPPPAVARSPPIAATCAWARRTGPGCGTRARCRGSRRWRRSASRAWVSDREARGRAEWLIPVVWAQHRGQHRPDLGIEVDGVRVAVEVELSHKSPRRLQAILAGHESAISLGPDRRRADLRLRSSRRAGGGRARGGAGRDAARALPHSAARGRAGRGSPPDASARSRQRGPVREAPDLRAIERRDRATGRSLAR